MRSLLSASMGTGVALAASPSRSVATVYCMASAKRALIWDTAGRKNRQLASTLSATYYRLDPRAGAFHSKKPLQHPVYTGRVPGPRGCVLLRCVAQPHTKSCGRSDRQYEYVSGCIHGGSLAAYEQTTQT